MRMAVPFCVRKPAFIREGYDASMSCPQGRGLFPAIILAFTAQFAWPANAIPGVPPILTSGQIVEQIQQHNKARSEVLKQYKALRHYQVEYRGFSAKIGAKMDVEVNYDAATGKSFRIISQSGSRLLCDKVLKRAVDSEKEASQDKGSTALTESNYRFQLAGNEIVAGRPAYILDVQPLTASKETEPAKNPSFWISKTLIHSTSTETDGFWLPQQLRSETKVRIGGTAVLTIDYGTYAVVPDVALLGVTP